ncbi:conserved membrane protein of unknown function [Candidatus Hydrogenisulfobacillus filiaventi]|uniref:Vitamin K epoxide reductase domain-containing protein n=1 Tax=Candidatus Hydrogenisulfobacillus filiaventi TaxID=2707344 RepID=A0A6F8ZHW1_9FIRM|nr:conserved membrane protein of unknown function [Candidatus Hydrogenisulfobacillus filiaventi]
MAVIADLVVVAALAMYVTGAEWAGGAPVCPSSGVVDCAAVLSGSGSHPLGVPLALWGAAWALAGLAMIGAGRRWRLAWIAAGGMGILWAWTHEWADLRICLWCSAIQIGAIVAMAILPEWAGLRIGLRRMAAAWRSGPAIRWQVLGSAALAMGGFWAWRLILDLRYPMAVAWSLIWAMVAAAATLLWLARRRAPRPAATAWVLPGSFGTAMATGAAACAGVCAPGGAWLLGWLLGPLGLGVGLVAQTLLILATAWLLVVGILAISG